MSNPMHRMMLTGRPSVPLATRFGMTDLGAIADCTRASLAYGSRTGRTYEVDELRRYPSRGGSILEIEAAGTQLGPAGGDVTASPYIAPNSELTDLGNDTYRVRLRNMSDTFFYLYDGAAITGKHTLCFWWRKTPGTELTGVLTVQGHDAANEGPYYVTAQTPPTEWTKVRVTVDEPGTSIRLAFFDTGGVDFEIRFCQFEESPYPTSWIPGPGTARSGDLWESPFSAPGDFTVMLGVDLRVPMAGGEYNPSTTQVLIAEDFTNYNKFIVYVDSTGKARTRQGDGGTRVLVDSPAAETWTAWQSIAVSYSATTGVTSLYVGGVLRAQDTLGVAASPINNFEGRWSDALQVMYAKKEVLSADQISAISADLLARLAS